MTHLLLKTTVGAPGGDLHLRSEKNDASPAFPFSRLFARHLAETTGGRSEPEQTDAAGRQRNSRTESGTDPDPKNIAKSDAGIDRGHSTDADPGDQVPGDRLFAGFGTDGILTGGFDSWCGMTGLVQITETSGLGKGASPGFSAPDGISTGFGSRLASEIAAHYSSRDGIQTLTMKLEPGNLGQVDVRLQAKADHLSVQLRAANPESEAALRENIKELTEAIQKRTGRFQHIEVRVDLKGNNDLRHDPAEKDHGQSPEQDPWEGTSKDPDTTENFGNHHDDEVETKPDERAQGG